jgi:putative oxidoreductase
MQHGFAKLSKGPDAFAAILQAMGVPGPHLVAWLTILIELLSGPCRTCGRIRGDRQCADNGGAIGGYV